MPNSFFLPNNKQKLSELRTQIEKAKKQTPMRLPEADDSRSPNASTKIRPVE